MLNSNLQKFIQNLPAVLFIFFFTFAFQVFAQSSDGSVPDPGSAITPPADPATSAIVEPKPLPVSTPTPTPKITPTPAPKVETSIASEPETIQPLVDTSSNNASMLPVAAGAVGLGALVFLGAFFGLKIRKNKKKGKKDEKRCLNFKKLMEEKLQELTDLKSQIKSFAKDKTIEQIKTEAHDPEARKLISLVEAGEKEYGRLKELYEKCIISLPGKKTTLLFLYKPKEKKILLAMKKRDFGKNKWNGVGGKLNAGETIKEALVREAQEEIAVVVNSNDMVQVATIDFYFQNNFEWNQQVHVFFTEKWEGEPTETEEMNPKWYSVDSLPYENMWIDDRHWLPIVLEGKKLNASFTFNKEGDKILEKKVNEY